MSESTRRPEASSEMLLVACPTDASVNRVPRAKLDRNPKCGRCHNPLFAGKVVELNGANFDSHAIKSDLPVVIDFWAEWCGPCRMTTPNFERAAPRWSRGCGSANSTSRRNLPLPGATAFAAFRA